MGAGPLRMSALAALLGGAVVLLGTAAIDEVVDQRQDLSEEAEGLVVDERQDLAQTVTAGMSGSLAGVRLSLSCSPGTLRLEIQGVDGGLPDGRVLASESLTVSPESRAASRLDIPVTGLPRLAAGESYAIVVGSSGDCVMLGGPNGDSYPGGQGLFRLAGSRTWEPLGEGRDLLFQTLMIPRADKIVAGVNLDGDENEDDKDRHPPQGGYVAVRCFIEALGRP